MNNDLKLQRKLERLDLTNPIFSDERQALTYLEEIRWPKGRICPKCGEDERTSLVRSRHHRPGLYYCNGCRKTFTVTVGTIFQGSQVPLNKWLLVFRLMVSSKKGMSALQVQRMIGVTYNTAWSMCHRIREALGPTEKELKKKLGGDSAEVEVDETYWGNKKKKPRGARGFAHKMKIISIVERGEAGQKRSFHVQDTKATTVMPLLKTHVDDRSRMMTDESSIYNNLCLHFHSHETVNHSSWEYTRGDVTTNTVEASFALVKRALRGIFHQVSAKYLHRYLKELDYKWNTRTLTDGCRMRDALRRTIGRRISLWTLKNA